MRYRTTLRSHFLHSFTIKPHKLINKLISDTQNPEISGFSTTHLYKYKTKRQAKMKRRQEKNYFLLIFVDTEKHSFRHIVLLHIQRFLVLESLIDKFTFLVNILLKFSRRK